MPAAGERVVHWSEVTIKSRVVAKYPEEAKAQGLEGACTVRVHLDVKGVPTGVEPKNCPEIFRESTVDATMAWRFYAPRLDAGEPVACQFDLKLNYVLANAD